MKILCLDRDKVIRDIIKNILEVLEAEIYEAETVAGAYAILNNDKFNIDLLIMELMLPDTNGIDFLRSLKEDSLLKSLPVVIVSAINKKDKMIEAMQAGAHEYITKPFASEELLTKIVQTLGLTS